jgi:hypothetical protein
MLPAIVSLSIAAGVFFGKRYFVQELFFFVGLTALLVFIGANVVVIGFLFHKAVQSVSRSVRTAKPNYAPRDESVREGLFAAPPIPSGERAGSS